MRDYTMCRLSKQERIRYSGIALLGGFMIFFLFYRSAIISFLLSLTGIPVCLRYQKKRMAERIQWQLMLGFKDAMESLVSALVAGYSMENAVSEAYRDMELIQGRETPMLWELGEIKRRLTLGETLDRLLMDLGRRSGVEDIVTFAQIYATARRSGGNLVKVMKRTADNISEKVEIQREIRTAMAGKRMEAVCMMVIPLLIILYLQIFSPGFLDPLYRGLGGRMYMTVFLLVYLAAVLWSRRIMKVAEG